MASLPCYFVCPYLLFNIDQLAPISRNQRTYAEDACSLDNYNTLIMTAVTSTPVNTVSRDNLTVLIRNNIMNESLEFASDCDKMETDSPVRKHINLQPIIKKLFHSPVNDSSPQTGKYSFQNERKKQLKRKLRRRSLIPDGEEKIKMAYVKECDKDSYSPESYGGMRKRVLISLFHNKEYSMDCCD